jgi:hypothetical protein
MNGTGTFCSRAYCLAGPVASGGAVATASISVCRWALCQAPHEAEAAAATSI